MRPIDKAIERTFIGGKMISSTEVESKSPLRRIDYKVEYKGEVRVISIFFDPLIKDEGKLYLDAREDAAAFKHIYDTQGRTK